LSSYMIGSIPAIQVSRKRTRFGLYFHKGCVFPFQSHDLFTVPPFSLDVIDFISDGLYSTKAKYLTQLQRLRTTIFSVSNGRLHLETSSLRKRTTHPPSRTASLNLRSTSAPPIPMYISSWSLMPRPKSTSPYRFLFTQEASHFCRKKSIWSQHSAATAPSYTPPPSLPHVEESRPFYPSAWAH